MRAKKTIRSLQPCDVVVFKDVPMYPTTYLGDNWWLSATGVVYTTDRNHMANCVDEGRARLL